MEPVQCSDVPELPGCAGHRPASGRNTGDGSRVGNPPRPRATAHHWRATRNLTIDHLGKGSSTPLHTLRTFLSSFSPLLTAARSG